MSPRLAFAVQSAFEAGRSTLRHFGVSTPIESKEDSTPVTQADREAESHLRHCIESAYPGEPVLGEEFGGDEGALDRWVLDPIDGTKSFICGVPLYATLVSYEVDQKPVLAAAYFPALDEMVYAETGSGCYLNGRECRVSPCDELAHSTLCCAGHVGLARAGKLDGILRLAESARAIRTWCDAYGHCLVATGRVEAMIDPKVSRWDVSSVSLLVREAGGSATLFDGDSAIGEELVTSNGRLHPSILGAFRP